MEFPMAQSVYQQDSVLRTHLPLLVSEKLDFHIQAHHFILNSIFHLLLLYAMFVYFQRNYIYLII